MSGRRGCSREESVGRRFASRLDELRSCQTLQCDRRFRRTGRSFPHKNAGFRANDPLVRPLLSIRGHKPSEGGTDHGDVTHAHVARLFRSDKPMAYYRRAGREANPTTQE